MVATQNKVLALIPARGGSKSLPRKNIRSLGGHPLIAYSIVAGLNAKSVGRVIVSTDNEEISEIANKYGAQVPFLRPSELAQDDVPDLPVFKHALQWLEKNEGYKPEIIVQLRPTSPLRSSNFVDDAISLLRNNPMADSVRGVTFPTQNPYKMWRKKGKYLIPLVQNEYFEPYNMPRQKLPQVFWQTGHVDAIRHKTIVRNHSMTGKKILPLFVDPRYAVDIDNVDQWMMAEWILSHWNLDIVKP